MLTTIKGLAKRTGIFIALVLVLALLAACGNSAQSSMAPIVAGKTTTSLPTGTTGVPITTGNVPAKTEVAQGKMGSISVAFDKTAVNAGDSFLVNVMITSNSSTRGAAIALNFDSSAMQCEEVIEGNFFKDWAKQQEIDTLVFPEGIIDNEKGTVSETGVQATGMSRNAEMGQPDEPLTGSGVLLSYKMTAKPGVNKQAQVTITSAFVSAADGEHELDIKEFAINNGTIKIGTP